MRLVIISDTHGSLHKIKIPDGDLLVHCGDLTGRGKLAEVERFNQGLGELPHRQKVVIAGNHDWAFQTDPEAARAAITNARYLQDELVEIFGLRIYGSPWQPAYKNWAFNLPRDSDELQAKWAAIPAGVDILLTHGPPYGLLDRTIDWLHVGCRHLRNRVLEVAPKVHAFGHIHEGYGMQRVGDITFINASSVNHRYMPVNEPVVIDL